MSAIEEAKKAILKKAKESNEEWQIKLHISLVRDIAVKLAQKLGADSEIVEISAWLHDFSRLGESGEDHHIRGAAEAERILKQVGYPPDKIKAVRHCIEGHRASDILPESLEAKVVSAADAMSHFHVMPLLFWIAGRNGKDRRESFDWVSEKIKRDWEKKILFPEAREMVKKEYDAIATLLESMKKQFEK